MNEQDLRSAAASGVRWTALARLAVEVVAFGSSVVLAHLIPPAEFGRAAVALSLAAIGSVLAAQGFGAPLVRLQAVDSEQIEATALLAILIGVAMTLLTILLLGPVVAAAAFGERIARFIEIASPIFALGGIAAVPTALLQRALDFRTLARIEVAGIFAGVAASVALAAAAGLDGEALILGAVTTAAVSSLLTIVAGPHLVPRWRPRAVREIVAFGVPTALSTVAYVTFKSVDYAILATRLPARQVGLYWRAYQLGIEYQAKFSGIMLRLAFPIYARTADAAEMRRLRGRIVRMHTLVLFPLLAILIVVAPEVVPGVFGSAWKPAVVPTQILAAAGMCVAAGTGTGPLMLAAGKPKALLVFDLAVLIAYGSVILAVSPYGLTAISAAVLGFQLVVLACQLVLLENRQVGIPLAATAGAIVPALAGSILVVALGIPLERALRGTIPDAGVVIVAGAVGACAYLAVLRTAFRPAWAEAWRDIRILARPAGASP